MLNKLDLFKARALAAVTQSESVSRAAEALRVTPSAISQSIKSLEKDIGRPLFHRVGKRLKATDLAHQLAERSEHYFSELASLLDGTAAQGEEIRIGAPPLFGSSVLLEGLDGFLASHPGVRVLVSLLDTQRLLDDLVETKLDFVFVDGGCHGQRYRELVFEPCWSEELVLCCSSAFHRAHLAEGVSYDTLRALPHIPYHRGDEAIGKWYRHHFGKVPDFPFSLAIDHAYGVLKAVVAGRGLGVVPRSLVEELVERKEVVVVRGKRGGIESEILLAQNKGRVPGRTERGLVRELERALRLR